MIFTAHDYFMDCAEAYCSDCEWYGNDSELSQEKQAPFDSVLCPDCSARLSEPYYTMSLNNRQIRKDEIDSFVEELTYHVIQFNRKHGYLSLKHRGLFNAEVMIGMHGQLSFSILDREKFNQNWDSDNLEMRARPTSFYTPVRFDDLEINQPEHFDIYKARDLLHAFEVFSNRLENRKKVAV